jgi:hypothetical protein
MSKHDVHLWWSTVGEVEGTSGAARGPSVAFRRAQAWAACSSVVSAYGPRGRVVRVPGGRPTVTGVDLELSFAYAGPIVAIAVTRGRPIGVDAEPLSGRVDDSLARHALAAPELEAFERLHPSLRRDALLRAWVRKEAVLKAAGVGLQIEPARVETGVGRLTGEPVVVPGAGSFRLVDLGIEGFAGALAAGGTAPVRIRWPCARPVTADTAPLADAVRGSRGRSSRRPLLSA